MEEDVKSDVPSVEIAIQILELLSRYRFKRSTLTEIQKKLGLNKSTCLRILRVLKKHKYVSYDEIAKKYGLGVSLVVLGTRAAEFSDALEIAKPYLNNLMESMQLTTVLVQQKSNNRLVYIIKEEPESPIRVHVNVGQYFPISPSAFGKCFLAYMDENERKQILKEIQRKKYTPKTITNIELLQEELKNVVEKGYAVSHEELTLGVTGIASPIFDMHGMVSMVILCLGVTAHVKEEMVAVYGEKIKNTAIEVTKELGGKFPDNYTCTDGD